MALTGPKRRVDLALLRPLTQTTTTYPPPVSLAGKRAGFFLGDGAGVGKGRAIAAMILQHFKEGGKRAL